MPLKLSQYTVDEKVNVVQWHRTNGHNVSKTAREFGVNLKRVRESNSAYDNLLLDNVGTSKMKRKLRQNLIWISRAWENISQQTIIDAFLSNGISNNLDGTDDWVSEKFPSLNEGDLRGELGDLLFDSDTDSKLDFDEFDECDI